jgi:hypothetical protein
MNEDSEVIERLLRLSNARRRPAELAGQDARDFVDNRRADVDLDHPGRPRASTSSAVPEKFNAEM